MAQLLKSEKTIFDERTLRQLEVSTVDYATFFEGPPLFVTYYSKDVLASGVEPTLDASVGILESDSPARFNKIEELPLFNVSGLPDITTELGEMGLETEIDGEAIIVPSTIEPLENDFFTLPNLSEQYLFKVDRVDHDKISGKQFLKISFHLVMEEVAKLDELVEDEYVLDYDRLGSTETKPVIRKTDHLLIAELDIIHSKLIDIYREYFYYAELNYFHIEVNNDDIFDPLLTKFIIDHKLLIQPDIKDYLLSITPSDVLFDSTTTNLYIKPIYKATVYNALAQGSKTDITAEKLSFKALNNVSVDTMLNELNFEGKELMVANYLLGSTYQTLDVDFPTNCSSGEEFDTPLTHYFENFLINHFNNKLNNSSLVEVISEMDFEYDIRTFAFIPMLIFIIKDTKAKLVNN